MSLDIQIQTSVLLSLVQANVQQALDTNCFPQFSTYYIDHADVTGGTAGMDPAGAQFQIPVNVFIVDQASLQANLNGVPPGAFSNPTVGTVLLQLNVQGTQLSLTCTGVLSSDPLFQPALDQIKQTLGIVGSVDFSPIFSKLHLPKPAASIIEQISGSLLIRFDPLLPALDHLQRGENWCAFVDAETMQGVAQSNVPLDKLAKHGITGVTPSATWAPSGLTPHVDIKVTGAAQVPTPFSGSVELDLGVDFLLQHVIPKDSTQSPDDLEELINWTLSIDLGKFAPQFLDNYVASKISAQLTAADFGGTAVGPQEVAVDSNLPPTTFGGATLAYSSLVGLQDGMVLGGPITGILAPTTSTLSFDINPFPSIFYMEINCLWGGPPPGPTQAEVTTRAYANYSGAGKVCSIQIVSPTKGAVDANTYLAASPVPGSLTDTGTISFTLSGWVAFLIAFYGQPIQVLLQTTRGVRMLNFGLPPTPVFDSNGNVTNVQALFDNNCPGQPVPWWQLFHRFNPQWGPDPPYGWASKLNEVERFQSLLVTVSDVQQGDVIALDQPIDGGRSIFTGNSDGQVTIPMLLAGRSFDEQAIVSSISRTNLGDITISAVFFRRVALLDTPGAIFHSLSSDAQGATIESIFSDRTESTRIDAMGVPQTTKNEPAGLSPARVTAVASAKSTRYEEGNLDNGVVLPGLVRILSVPGHEDSSLAVGKLDDGSYRALAKQNDGSVRVCGVIARWSDMPAVSGNWAISASTGDRIAVFAVSRMPARPCNCHCIQ